MSKRTFRALIITLFIPGISALSSCVVSGPDSADEEFSVEPLADQQQYQYQPKSCTEQAPLHCVSACGLDPVMGVAPYCEDGQWACTKGVVDDTCPEFIGDCSPNNPCGFGYSCVHSLKHPIPANDGVCRKGVVPRDGLIESCDPYGTIDSQQLVDEQVNLTGGLIKIAGRVGVTLNCANEACFGDNPCCNTCMANYMMEIKDPHNPARKLNLLIKTEAVPCMGTNCGISCTPLTVGETYRMWGLLEECQGQSNCTLLFMGACPL